ncbi:MAG: DUF4152 family protein [Candidatus Bathyarchaeia archaeon]
MRIVAADSSAAILNEKFEPLSIIATASVLVNPPYREPSICLAKPIFANAQNGYEVIVHEAELCKDLLEKVKADVVHLDMSLGSVFLEEFSPIQFSSMKISNKAKRHLLKILPRLRKISGEIRQKYGVKVLAIGKESIPVRIAELTSGAHAILYACKKLPMKIEKSCSGFHQNVSQGWAEKRVYLYSLMAAEHNMWGYAEDSEEVLKRLI